MFAPGQVQTLLRALLSLTEDRGLLVQLGAAACEYVRASGLSWQAHAAQTLALYKSLV
jgi:glycosyltransferase involved in cell wall biosynthesis